MADIGNSERMKWKYTRGQQLDSSNDGLRGIQLDNSVNSANTTRLAISAITFVAGDVATLAPSPFPPLPPLSDASILTARLSHTTPVSSADADTATQCTQTHGSIYVSKHVIIA